MPNNLPLFSVVIPLYNKEKYIERCLRSVLAQTERSFEVIVVDDQSKDASVAAASRVSDTRIKIVRRSTNGGQSAARNTGIEHAVGHLIAFLDADDEWLPRHLESIRGASESIPTAGLYATGYRTLYPTGTVQEVTLQGSECIEVNDYFVRSRYAGFVWISAIAVPAAVFDKYGRFLDGEHIGGDIELVARIALHCPIGFCPEISAVYRADSQGRENPRKDRKHQIPPFSRTLLQHVGSLDPKIAIEAREFSNLLWLTYLRLPIQMGNRSEVKRVLRIEMDGSRVYKWKAFRYKIYATLLPMRVFEFFWRFEHSRWWPRRSVDSYVVVRRYRSPGVVTS